MHNINHISQDTQLILLPPNRIERFLSRLVRKIHDRARPERNIGSAYADEVSARHVTSVFREHLGSSFETNEAGSKLWEQFIVSANPLSSLEFKQPIVTFPRLIQRKPYVLREELPPRRLAEVRVLLQSDPDIFPHFSIQPIAWEITSGVRIHGQPRSCTMQDERKSKSRGQASTALFILDAQTIGHIDHFTTVTVENTRIPGVSIDKQLARVLAFPRHYDHGARMSYIDINDYKEVYIHAARIGRDRLALGDMRVGRARSDIPQQDLSRRFVLRAETGLRPSQLWHCIPIHKTYTPTAPT